jgi:hypothetical protein
MRILIFDMDGVLIEPHGYHRALKETVRLAGIATGKGEVRLKDDQIAQFEAFGISSEWHSTALCMAVLALEKESGLNRVFTQSNSGGMNLELLFQAIDAQPMHLSALQRGVAAVELLAQKYDVPADPYRNMIARSESIEFSPTLNWFQELVLGSHQYSKIYQKAAQFQTESYLLRYDKSLLMDYQAKKIMEWVAEPGHAAAIMTNRPSNGPAGFSGMPDAEMGANLAGISDLSLVGKGEILWLADRTGQTVEQISKPAWKHAFSAVLAASGLTIQDGLDYFCKLPKDWEKSGIQFLDGSTLCVFEDTPGGILSAQEAANFLHDQGIQVEVKKIGIANESAKQEALSAQKASVYADINMALESLDYF